MLWQCEFLDFSFSALEKFRPQCPVQFRTDSLNSFWKESSDFFSNRQPCQNVPCYAHVVPNAFLSMAHKHTSSLFLTRPLSRKDLAFHALRTHTLNPTKVTLSSSVKHLCLHRLTDVCQPLAGGGHTQRMVAKAPQENAAPCAVQKSFIFNWNIDYILNWEQIQAASEDNWDVRHRI